MYVHSYYWNSSSINKRQLCTYRSEAVQGSFVFSFIFSSRSATAGPRGHNVLVFADPVDSMVFDFQKILIHFRNGSFALIKMLDNYSYLHIGTSLSRLSSAWNKLSLASVIFHCLNVCVGLVVYFYRHDLSI
jgi:hypothetical protein